MDKMILIWLSLSIVLFRNINGRLYCSRKKNLNSFSYENVFHRILIKKGYKKFQFLITNARKRFSYFHHYLSKTDKRSETDLNDERRSRKCRNSITVTVFPTK